MTNDNMKRIKLNRAQYDAMTGHVKSNIPEEACGILLGRIHKDTALVQEVKPMRNITSSENMFTVDPEELFRNLIRAESLGLEMVGIYHSHHMNPHPSSIDYVYMKLNPVVWVIFGISRTEITGVAAYRWLNGRVTKVGLEVG
nr:M67 family metallopeptidase [Candidatus Njordarchaeum guaymaensis]